MAEWDPARVPLDEEIASVSPGTRPRLGAEGQVPRPVGEEKG